MPRPGSHKTKAAASLLFAVVLLLPPLFFWWRLAYLYNLPQGGSELVWKRDRGGILFEDLSTPASQLRYNLGFVPEERILARFSWSSPEAFEIGGAALAVWALIQLYLGWYLLRSPR